MKAFKMPCWYQASMEIIAVVAFGNGREAYPSQHKSQVRCPWDNLTWKILLCPRISVSQHCVWTALHFWQDAPVCFHHPASLSILKIISLRISTFLSSGCYCCYHRGEGRVWGSPTSQLVLPCSFAFAGCGHMRALRLWAKVCVSRCRHSVLAV